MTKIRFVESGNRPKRPGFAALFVWEGGLSEDLPHVGARLKGLARQEGFEGRKDQSLLLLEPEKEGPRVLLCGLGKAADFDLETLRRAASKAARQARDLKQKEALLVLPAEQAKGLTLADLAGAAAEGAWLGLYQYRRFRSPKPEDKKDPETLLLTPAGPRARAAAAQAALKRAEIVCESVCWTRDQVNAPPSHLFPEEFAREVARARAKAKAPSLGLTVLGKARIEALKMGSFLGVARGSDKPPVFVHLHYRPSGKIRKTVALVGKGVTFDSGGLSLKPSGGMEDMKCDMAGAAAVVGTVLAAARLGLPVEIHGLCPVTENMPNGRALKPGDVVTASSGKTVEVLNTDAEGRLILADALTFGARLKPDVMIDMATLTGAAIVALGSEITALMGDSRVVEGLKAAGARAGEKNWELPLAPEYREHIKSRIADIKNTGKAGQAGTIIGGLFLKEFVPEGIPWVHMDIAGPAFLSGEAGLLPQGGTGVPVRTLVNYLEGL